MLTTHAVGIDLGTTYSCIAYLNEHGEPVTLPNQEGELSTPSVVLFDGPHPVVGTEALRNSIVRPDRVVQHAKRFMGSPTQRWTMDGRPFTPTDISALVLKKLLSAAQEQIGPIEQAVITVPAQFSDGQRQATVDAGLAAGLQRVDVINEPVAAALCYVLGTEGLWFTELADSQRILVYDLGGGTFDLSVVKYQKNEVSVIASAGDLNLGGIDWNHALEKAICAQFSREFGSDPRTDPESLQAVALEAEQAKRSLTVRPRAAFTVQHAGHRKTYQVEQAQFERLTKPLLEKTREITKQMLKENKLGWAHVDVVLTTGGSSRMPMVRNMLKELSGRTLNTSLSPDQSIAHGATYYAGMLLTNTQFARSILSDAARERLSQVKQRSVNARSLGILVRDMRTGKRVPHYLVPPNTPLPTEVTQNFGTVKHNQRRVHLQIVESGTSPDKPPVRLGACLVEDLPPNLPPDSEIAVTIRYDEQARVRVSARDVTSGKTAAAEIIRHENLVPQLETGTGDDSDVKSVTASPASPAAVPPTTKTEPQPAQAQRKPSVRPAPAPTKPAAAPAPAASRPATGRTPSVRGIPSPPAARGATPPLPPDEEIIELERTGPPGRRPGTSGISGPGGAPAGRPKTPPRPGARPDVGEEEFWRETRSS